MVATLEIAANAVMTLSIVLAGRNSLHSWWLGVLGCSLFALLFYDVNLYADVALQVFFVMTCLLGWWRWRRVHGGQTLPIRRAQRPALLWMSAIALLATAGYGLLLQAYTNAYAPFVDSAVLAFSIVAQLLLMGRRIDTWPFWLLVNTISVPLYLSRGLQLTALLYGAYWINALVSWLFWRRQLEGDAIQQPLA